MRLRRRCVRMGKSLCCAGLAHADDKAGKDEVGGDSSCKCRCYENLAIGKLTSVQQNNDINKQPLLTDEQLRVIRRGHKRTKQGTPREEFERLFRGTALAASAEAAPR